MSNATTPITERTSRMRLMRTSIRCAKNCPPSVATTGRRRALVASPATGFPESPSRNREPPAAADERSTTCEYHHPIPDGGAQLRLSSRPAVAPPGHTPPLARLLAPLHASKARFRADDQDEIGFPDLQVHPDRPPVGRGGRVLVDHG